MSDPNQPLDPELQELSDRLEAAFRATRPSPGYADRLRASLPAGEPAPRRPWWRRRVVAPALAGAAAMIVLATIGVAAFNTATTPHPTGAPGGGHRTGAPEIATPSCPPSNAAPSPSPTGGMSAATAPRRRC